MEHKIIFAGTVSAGKTTAISSISDIEVVATEEKATDETAQKKSLTTVAMDYGVMKLDGGDRLHLYGTPGQERFSFMWDILTMGGLGLVILIDNTSESPLEDLRFYFTAFKDFIRKNPVVIGITHMDVSPVPRLSDFHAVIKQESGASVPIMEVDAREPADVKNLLQALFALIQFKAA